MNHLESALSKSAEARDKGCDEGCAMKLPISVTILVKNAQATIEECLGALQGFDEVILLDNGSEDKTLELARRFSNVRICTSEFIGFGALKNLAISYATNEWILSLDSDEILESETLRLIASLDFSSTRHIYALPRKNLYRGEWVKACGWHPDYVWRIFHKDFTRFNDNLVHESVIIPPDSITQRLPSGLRHYAFNDISHLLEKLQRYSSLWAQSHTHKRSSPLKATLRGLWTFVRNYLFKRGFLYGYKGFVISACNGLGAFFKYMKLYESTRAGSVSLIITTYNQKERLALVLDSVKHLSQLPTEVLIADDGSREDTRALIESFQAGFPCVLRHIWQEDRGFRLSAIRNKAVCAARGEYIIIIDGDMVLEPHFVRDHLRYARKGVFVQGSRVILDEARTQKMMNLNAPYAYKEAFKSGGLKAMRLALLSKLVFAISRTRAKVFKKKELIKGIRGCNMGFYREDCLAVNGFNEAFEGWGREDSEFVARFLFNGGELRRLKFSAIAYHLYHKENPRTLLESNHQIYLDTIAHKRVWCERGIESLATTTL